MLSKLSGLFTVLIYILMISLLVNGCFHSFKKHKDDPSWLQESPLVIYRGAEYFWHDDFAGVNWKERVNDDAGTAIQLIMASNGVEKIDDIKKQMDDLSNKISLYPKDKKYEIETSVRKYISFIDKVTKDFTSYVNNFPADSNFHISASTQSLLDSLNIYEDVGGIKALKKIYDSMASTIKNDPENIGVYRQRVNYHNIADDEFIEKSFFKIFKDTLR